ncbi:hypothetical protein EV175_000211 [Coemansia sp. RSA 1933]|nr:hypothetical protein EV175_000211 [Coemansia sp. RSA 1933]
MAMYRPPSPLPPPPQLPPASHAGRKRAGSEAATCKSTQSSGTYAEDAVAASIGGASARQAEDEATHLADNSTPRKRNSKRGKQRRGQQQQQQQQRRRSRSTSSVASPVSTHTLTEEHTATASSSEVGGAKNRKEPYGDGLMPWDGSLTVATVSVSVDESSRLSTLAEEEDIGSLDRATKAADGMEGLNQATREADDIDSLHQATREADSIDSLHQAADVDALLPDTGGGLDRCATHPGTRNDLWCQRCEQAICSRCIEGSATVGHRSHSVVKLSEAYDDTFEAIEALQLQLVSSLAETRDRTALLDGALGDLGGAFALANDQLSEAYSESFEAVDAQFHEMHAELEDRQADCQHWRGGIEETLATVQSIMEQMSQAQAVAQREPVLRLMVAAVRARPQAWDAAMPDYSGLAQTVRPCMDRFSVHVPSVAELGRKRGHVRVSADPAAVHGAVWAAEVRRSRNELGESCVAVTVTCAEGPAPGSGGAYRVGVAVEEAPGVQRFAQWHPAEWAQGQAHTFTVTTLEALTEAGVVSSADGGIDVSVSVQPESFRALAAAQAERIRVLEERLRKAAEKDAAERDGGGQSEQTPCSVGRPSRRRRSDSRGWATSPRAGHRRSVGGSGCGGGGSRRPSLAPTLPLPLLPHSLSPPQSPTHPPLRSPSLQYDVRPAVADEEPMWHRRAVSLTSKLRRQAPIPFPLTMRTRSVQSQISVVSKGSQGSQGSQGYEAANASQMSVTSRGSAFARLASSFGDDEGKPGGVLRRLSGWMRESGRVAHRARRAPRQMAGGLVLPGDGDSQSSGEEIDDWTLLDSEVLSPRPKASSGVLPPPMPAGRSAPPMIPLPPIPVQDRPTANEAEDVEDGFSFDGAADIEREQAAVDARHAARLIHDDEVQARYKSIVKRIDALQLIANTVENSRDGMMTEGTMRRISSEFSMIMDGRRRRIEDARARAATDLSPLGGKRPATASADQASDAREASRRSFSMDPADIRRAVARAVTDQPPPLPLPADRMGDDLDQQSPGSSTATSPRSKNSHRRVSGGSSSAGSRSARTATRRDSASAGGLSDTESVQQQQQQQQLTPQTRRQGGILKAGRTRRALPSAVRLQVLPDLLSPDRTAFSQQQQQPPQRRASGNASSSKPSVAPRKHVRFPEEQRLLETIRLVDPLKAQSIETRVAAATRAQSGPGALPAVANPVPVHAGRTRRDTSNLWSSDSEEDDVAVPVSGLAARVRSSPRLSPSPSSVLESDDSDNGTSSVLFESSKAAAAAYKRPPRPPLHMVLGHDQAPKEPSPPEGAAIVSVNGRQQQKQHRRPLGVGPNIASAQSSPVVLPLSGSNISSPLSDAMAVGSAVSQPSDVSVFGDDQIPVAACGRNTALADVSVQGPDLQDHKQQRQKQRRQRC